MNDETACILVVDDDRFTAELTGLILEASNYDTITARDGMEAFEKVIGNPLINIIVSDMFMPNMDGIQLFTELRQRGFMQPFLLLTGQDTRQIKEDNPSIDAVLTKDERLQQTLPKTIASLLKHI